MNPSLQTQINDCTFEINDISARISVISPFDKAKTYFTNYALIRACGTLEFVYRSIVADFIDSTASPQVRTYIEKTIRKGSMGISYDNMRKLLAKFDDTWESNFVNAVSMNPMNHRIIAAAKSLAQNRNEFAHGRNPSAAFSSIQQYYLDTLILINIFDSVVV